MEYVKIRLPSEAEYRILFLEVYCNPAHPIITFDGIRVRFFPEQFNHAFYESSNWQRADKSVFSPIRAERIMWIKDTLEDINAVLKVGWDKKKKKYDNSRRVAVVRNDYVVIIYIRSSMDAKFVTAYKADNSLHKILSGPDYR